MKKKTGQDLCKRFAIAAAETENSQSGKSLSICASHHTLGLVSEFQHDVRYQSAALFASGSLNQAEL
jgi:hypothetical protein